MELFPHERSLVSNLNGKPFVLLGVNQGDSDETVQKQMEDGTLTWRSFRDELNEDETISEAWEVEAWPTVYLIDAKGIVRHKLENPSAKQIDQRTAELLAEMEHSFPFDAVEKLTKLEKQKDLQRKKAERAKKKASAEK